MLQSAVAGTHIDAFFVSVNSCRGSRRNIAHHRGQEKCTPLQVPALHHLELVEVSECS